MLLSNTPADRITIQKATVTTDDHLLSVTQAVSEA
ncbi:PTS system beta-glucoside-specific transporter subunit IIABC [Lacticaseibacillus paracasei subsp. paracasei Lpp228]|nr:PTS system beta-glucoside-specific transporter subunit IIABC [Lacticaseibacillus paracasei subsp. paracasei Lpp228]